jgi:hypothetical protein
MDLYNKLPSELQELVIQFCLGERIKYIKYNQYFITGYTDFYTLRNNSTENYYIRIKNILYSYEKNGQLLGKSIEY